jgi:hypothetical protein
MWRLPLVGALILALSCSGSAQWHMQDSHTTADLRGIHSIGNGIAWASGTNGTILRTADDGDHWQLCATPIGAEGLDFRGIQAFDANTAIVMSSGKGDLSRLYKTTDACRTWKLVFTNPDKDGFWDALRFSKPWPTGPSEASGVLIGDPVAGTFSVFLTSDSGETWRRWGRGGFGWKGKCGERRPKASKDEALFAASNQSVFYFFSSDFLFVTGGRSGARLVYSDLHDLDGPPCWTTFSSVRLPLAHASAIQNWQQLAQLREDAVLLDLAAERARESHVALESLVSQRTAALQALTQRLFKTQDEERRKVARELRCSGANRMILRSTPRQLSLEVGTRGFGMIREWTVRKSYPRLQ